MYLVNWSPNFPGQADGPLNLPRRKKSQVRLSETRASGARFVARGEVRDLIGVDLVEGRAMAG